MTLKWVPYKFLISILLITCFLTQVTDSMMEDSPKMFPFNPPRIKEAYYYRQIFERLYPAQAKWIPYYWMQRWSKTNDPSARTLKHYKDSDVQEKDEKITE